MIGFVGNEIAAQVRLRGRRRLARPALIAAGNHTRIDSFASLGVVALGARIADPVIGLVITLVIIKITWDSGASSRRASQASASSSLTRFLGQQTGSKRSKSSLRKHAQIRRQKAANPHQ